MQKEKEIKAGVIALNVVSDDKFLEINGKRIEVKEYKGERVVTVYDISELHGREVKKINQQFKRNKEKFVEEKDYFQLKRSELNKKHFFISFSKFSNNKFEYIFTASGYLKLIKTFENNLEYKIIKEVYEFLGGNENIDIYVPNERFEISFFKLLKEALKEIDVKLIHQHYVLGYRIDFFLPEYNLAIEYDEEGHKFHKKEDKLREEKIKKEIGCKFIRCSHKDSNIKNLMMILKKIKFICK